MSNPLVSIIVANYNNGKFIRECLDSLIAQTYRPIEILVGDDASTDNSRDIIDEYEQKYPGMVKGILHPKNIGVIKNRPLTIEYAQGQYLTTIDSDDYFYVKDKLEKEMDLALFHKQKLGRDIVAYSNIVRVNENGKELWTWGTPETLKEGMVYDDILTRNCMVPRDFIISREMYDRIGGFDTTLKLYEDWDIKIKLARHYNYYYTNITGIAYRQVDGGISSLPIKKNMKLLKTCFDIHIKTVPPNKRPPLIKGIDQFIKRVLEKHN